MPPRRGQPLPTYEQLLGSTSLRPLNQERCFEPNRHSSFYMICRQRRFWSLIQRRAQANLSLVREYYARAQYNMNLAVTIRGVPIEITAESIRTHLQIPPVQDCAFQHARMHPSEITDEMIRDTICLPGADVNVWIREHRRRVFVLRSALTPPARAWLYFILGNIWPNSHVSDAPRDVALLIYLFSHQRPVDIPSLIFQTLRNVVLTPTRTSRIDFPHLVSELILAAGVQAEETDILLDPVEYFDYERIIQRVTGVHAPHSPPVLDGPLDDDPVPEDQPEADDLPAAAEGLPEPELPHPAGGNTVFETTVLGWLERIENRMERIEAHQRRSDARQGRIEDSIRDLRDRWGDRGPRDP